MMLLAVEGRVVGGERVEQAGQLMLELRPLQPLAIGADRGEAELARAPEPDGPAPSPACARGRRCRLHVGSDPPQGGNRPRSARGRRPSGTGLALQPSELGPVVVMARASCSGGDARLGAGGGGAVRGGAPGVTFDWTKACAASWRRRSGSVAGGAARGAAIACGAAPACEGSMRKVATSALSCSSWRISSEALAALCSASAEFCCVISSMRATAVLISSMPCACSEAAEWIVPIICATSPDACTMLSSARPWHGRA